MVLDREIRDGRFTTAAVIRHHAEYSATRIVMLASSGNGGDAARCAKLDIQAYLQESGNQNTCLRRHPW
jgi:DNA-binding NarL/FixJ family response regulator